MKRVALLLLLGVCFVPGAFAQDDHEHVQVGIYADYFRMEQTNTDFAGLGGRFAFQLYKQVKLEAEMSYDFDKVFTENFTDPATTQVTVQRSNLHLLHGMVGPRINIGRHAIQPFITLKGGFINSQFNTAPASVAGFVSSVNNLRSNNWMGTLYPGGGIEGHLGPIGLRLDVGDEIYFNNGSHNNLRVAFGPFIRF
jgi:hypothetical protein